MQPRAATAGTGDEHGSDENSEAVRVRVKVDTVKHNTEDWFPTLLEIVLMINQILWKQ